MSSETPIIDELTAETATQDVVQSNTNETQDDNGYVDVHDLIRNEVEAAEAAAAIVTETVVKPIESSKVVVAEPDSSSDLVNRQAKKSIQSEAKCQTETSGTNTSCSKCPMRQSCGVTSGVCNLCESVANYLNTNKCAKSLLLWENPKYTGAVLVVSLLVVELLARNSLLWNFGTLTLLTMTVAGSYRFYLFVMNRVKGVEDQTFTRLAAQKLELPHDTLRNTVDFVERNGNDLLNRFKLLLLWNNLYDSAIAYVVAYTVYSIGCCLNILTLVTLTILTAFTVPKVYTVYKVQIDNGLMKFHNTACELLQKVQDKLPAVFKRKRN